MGAGLALGSKAAISDEGDDKMGFGININALAQIVEKIDAEVSLSYYFPSEPVDGIKFQLTTISLNGHYNFIAEKNMTVYGLAGLNYSIGKVEMERFGTSISDDESEIGLNLGAGGAFGITDNIDLTGQVGYTFGDADQLFLNVGVMYKF
ncbi:MAG TPA: outer membrane beta-barrel protein [Bacteroidales bacterium]